MELEPIGSADGRGPAGLPAGTGKGGPPTARTHQPVIGLELYGGLGNSRRIGLVPARQEHHLQPVMMFHLIHRAMIHVGLAIGLSKTSDNLIRTALALAF